jgi:NitT/TauT family transport system substrate-binding protein
MGKRLLRGLFGLAAAILVAAPAAAAEQTPIILLDSNIINYLPAYVAIDQGMFTRHGLNVTRTIIPNAAYTTTALFSKTAQVGTLSPIPLIQATTAGLDLIAIATTDVVPSPIRSGVVVREDSPIKTAQDLIGKKVAVAGINGALHVLTRKWLGDSGVDVNKVTFVELPFSQMSDALRSNLVDAVTSVDPFMTRIIDAHVGKDIFELLSSTPPGTASAFYACTAEWAKAHKDAVAGFRAALDEAASFIATHPDQARQILATYTKLPVQSIQQTPFANYQFKASAAQIQYWSGISKQQGLIDAEPDAAAMVLP